jgi:hypothetical protein
MRYNPFAEPNNRLPRLCAWTQERLFAYADDSLNATERRTVQAHLDTCADCRQELALCRQAESVLLGARAAIPAPGDLRAGFYARLAEQENAAPPRRRSPQWGLALSACAAVALFAILWRPVHTTETSAPPASEIAVAPTDRDIYSKTARVATQRGRDRVTEFKRSETRSMSLALSQTRNKAEAEKLEKERAPVPAILSKEVSRGIQSVVAALAYTLKNARVRSEQPAVASLRYKTADLSKSTDRYLGIQPQTEHYDFMEERKERADGLARREIARGLERDESARQFGAEMKTKSSAPYLFAMSVQTQNGQLGSVKDNTLLKQEAAEDFSSVNAAIIVASVPADQEEASLEVVDEERGFRANVRHASRVDSDEDGEVLTIESDDTTSDADPVSTQ